MTPKEKTLVQNSFKLVVPIAYKAAALFYKKLFELDPAYESLFTGDMEQQGAKLMQTLVFSVTNLDNLETLVPAVEDLAIRHVEYGVKANDYPVVGEALLWMLQEGIGDAFTDDVKDAWTTMYTLLSDIMIAAAY